MHHSDQIENDLYYRQGKKIEEALLQRSLQYPNLLELYCNATFRSKCITGMPLILTPTQLILAASIHKRMRE